LAGFGVSHPLARRIGAWPSVFAVAAVSGGASNLLADRRGERD
jgi:zinc transporter ZupT